MKKKIKNQIFQKKKNHMDMDMGEGEIKSLKRKKITIDGRRKDGTDRK